MSQKPTTQLNDAAAKELSEADERILKAVHDVKFGSVEITVHNGRVVQVERREKIRLSNDSEGKSDAR